MREYLLCLLAAAAADGVAVPETLSVVGIDNMPFGVLSHPPLTTVDQQVAELGRQAMKAALAAAAGEQVNDRVLESRLILRGSTGKARPMDESENL